MHGYKAMNKDWTCRGFKYETGKTYEIDGELNMFENGFHFCKNPVDCFVYYEYGECIIVEVEALGEIQQEGIIFVTSKIKILNEFDIENLLFDKNHNSGDHNRGWYNSGNYNSGCFNTNEPKMRFFNKEADITFKDFLNSIYYNFDTLIDSIHRKSLSEDDIKHRNNRHRDSLRKDYTMMIDFVIPGKPVGKGRPRHAGRVVYTPKMTRDYEAMVALKFREVYGGYCFDADVPLCVMIEAVYPIPKSKPKSVRERMAANVLRPMVKPDIDNVVKIVLDGLNGVAFVDDKQVCRVEAFKLFGDVPQVRVRISNQFIEDGEKQDRIAKSMDLDGVLKFIDCF